MIFSSYDAVEKEDCETEIKGVDSSTKHLFIQTWVTDCAIRYMRYGANFKYALFPWEVIINYSLQPTSTCRCYGAFTKTHLDGLLCLDNYNQVKIEFIATAPWNYYSNGKMRRIGSGLIYFTISSSESLNKEGEFRLNALPDAENYYSSIGMIKTGNTNREGLNEYLMKKENAMLFKTKFKEYVIQE